MCTWRAIEHCMRCCTDFDRLYSVAKHLTISWQVHIMAKRHEGPTMKKCNACLYQASLLVKCITDKQHGDYAALAVTTQLHIHGSSF